MTDAPLPAGWTLQQIRDVSGDRAAIPVHAGRPVRWCVPPEAAVLPHPAIVLKFHDLCLVQLAHAPDWYMGGLNDDGSIDCWSAYDDLHDALRGL
ncbi:hypothetical protein [Streptomyces rimosus]|uniref:hypothetical protein n=1 Tax=Streptomyces rimosus TaxID=1927 RepID=UPI0004CA8AD1|nr:hypothetical protein [Streptomyces rimosus]